MISESASASRFLTCLSYCPDYLQWWSFEPNDPFPPQIALAMVFHHSNSNPNKTKCALMSVWSYKTLAKSFLLKFLFSINRGKNNTHICSWESSRWGTGPKATWLLNRSVQIYILAYLKKQFCEGAKAIKVISDSLRTLQGYHQVIIYSLWSL